MCLTAKVALTWIQLCAIPLVHRPGKLPLVRPQISGRVIKCDLDVDSKIPYANKNSNGSEEYFYIRVNESRQYQGHKCSTNYLIQSCLSVKKRRKYGNCSSRRPLPFVGVGVFLVSLRQSKRPSKIIILPNYAVGTIGNTISILLLYVLFITYVVNKELRTASRNILPIVLLILMANTQQLIIVRKREIPSLCVTTAIILHWTYLSVLLLTLVLAHKMYQALGKPGMNKGKFDKKDSIISSTTSCLAVATVIVLICIILEFAGNGYAQYGKDQQCFVVGFWVNLFTFAIPVITSVTINTAILSVITFRLYCQMTSLNLTLRATRRRNVERIKVTVIALKLSTLLGLTWILEILGSIIKSDVLLHVFFTVNSFQGFLIFMAFCCNRRVRKFYRKVCCTRWTKCQSNFTKRRMKENETGITVIGLRKL